MIVDRATLNVKPITDKVLYELAGSYVSEVDRGAIAWSNELVTHVIELKTNGPALSLQGLHTAFQKEVDELNHRLEAYGAQLLPTAMHPWMNPYTEMKLWPHEYNPIYEAYNRIFDCRGHGWANLQSTHINLPFANDEEFEKLHAAIRVLLPILPGIAASSPVADLQKKSHADYRLEVYRTNSIRVPSITGYIVPEPVFTRQEYEDKIFKRMYRDIAPYDPGKILQDEWLNSRGAIARFGRGSIEIRVLDVQECPLADMAIARIVVDTLRALVNEQWSLLKEQKLWGERQLYNILINVIRDASEAQLGSPSYASLFGLSVSGQVTVGELWRYLFDQLYKDKTIAEDPVLPALDAILKYGTLSRRICAALPVSFSREEVQTVYKSLGNCLAEGQLFGIHE